VGDLIGDRPHAQNIIFQAARREQLVEKYPDVQGEEYHGHKGKPGSGILVFKWDEHLFFVLLSRLDERDEQQKYAVELFKKEKEF
jgi:hypothetical protein